MDCAKFSKVDAFKPGKTVESDTLVFGEYNNLASVLMELERANDSANLNLMLDYD